MEDVEALAPPSGSRILRIGDIARGENLEGQRCCEKLTTGKPSDELQG